jgi:tripeptidyl-peptidase I
MNFKITILLGSLAAFSLGAPSTRYEVHQKRDGKTGSQWTKRDVELSPRSVIPISIALSQRNLDKGGEFLMDVSDPFSSNYGKHWSPERVSISTTKMSSSNIRIRFLKLLPLRKPRSHR